MKIFLIAIISLSVFANELKIKANSFEADQKKGLSVFKGEVNIIKGSDEINASKITVFTDKDNKPIKYIAEGDVKFHVVTQEGTKYSGKSQKVVYMPLAKEYFFYDQVHIKQLGEKNEIIGDEVVIKTTEGKAKAKSNTNKPVIMIFDVKDKEENKKVIEIVESKFVISAPNIKSAPESELQDEIVFMARSNVGKSSLLNALTNHKGLAKVSSSPGKTRLINYFDVTFMDRDTDEKRSAKFVDLPGFGYAKVSKSIKSDWEKNLTDYISKRLNIKVFIHLIDCRHPYLDIDKSVTEFLVENSNESQYILQIFTKIDKLNQKEQNKLRREFPNAIMVSSAKKRGMQKVNNILYKILGDDLDNG